MDQSGCCQAGFALPPPYLAQNISHNINLHKFQIVKYIHKNNLYKFYDNLCFQLCKLHLQSPINRFLPVRKFKCGARISRRWPSRDKNKKTRASIRTHRNPRDQVVGEEAGPRKLSCKARGRRQGQVRERAEQSVLHLSVADHRLDSLGQTSRHRGSGVRTSGCP